jgi:hypothetical protein
MSYIEKEKLIKADIESIENRVRHAFNQGYDLGYKEGKERAKPQEPKTGHWIVAKGGSYIGVRNACCSSCKDFYTNDWNVMNYCPNCGCRMIEPQESEG